MSFRSCHCPFRKVQNIIGINAVVPHVAFNVRMPMQDPNCAQDSHTRIHFADISIFGVWSL